ncbi:HlyU family transcriptional regulator [Histidinibacterium lentulum]|uniref:Uncharacterized protein n=1 Tax=Histidinibacterium lentulum TaxID=2480588 RepID=A0A3N2R7C5_9RHOB|nr:HlyU family transcriptional regulator [Histidinibacterium lentulum]ROU03308.1 hypothetical protein EAT49_03095 [Histidinibacterium lentulum]
MSLWSRLFGSSSASQGPEPTEHDGFLIYPEPVREGTKWRIAARIEKAMGDEIRRHDMVRADLLDSQDEAVEATLRKARQMIDEQGAGIFH